MDIDYKIFGDRDQYMATTDGKIYSKCKVGSNKGAMNKEWKLIKPTVSKNGYLYFRINGRRGKNTYIHRVIASLFIEKKEGKNEVNHINCNKQDNSLINLEWVNRVENLKHAKINGLLIGRKNKFNPHRKMDDMQILTILTFKNYNMPLKILKNYNNKCIAVIHKALKGHTYTDIYNKLF